MRVRMSTRFVLLAGLALVLASAVAGQGLEPSAVLQQGGSPQPSPERDSSIAFDAQESTPAELVFLPLVVRAAQRDVWISHGPEGGETHALAIDPLTPATLYAGTYGRGVFKSTDGGRRWSAASTGLTATAIDALVVDPLTPAIVYAGTYGGGVFAVHPGEWGAP